MKIISIGSNNLTSLTFQASCINEITKEEAINVVSLWSESSSSQRSNLEY